MATPRTCARGLQIHADAGFVLRVRRFRAAWDELALVAAAVLASVPSLGDVHVRVRTNFPDGRVRER